MSKGLFKRNFWRDDLNLNILVKEIKNNFSLSRNSIDEVKNLVDLEEFKIRKFNGSSSNYLNDLKELKFNFEHDLNELEKRVNSKDNLMKSYLEPLKKLNEITNKHLNDFKLNFIKVDEHSNDLYNDFNQLPSTTITLPLFGSYDDCFSGLDIFNHFKLKLQLSDQQTIDFCNKLPIKSINKFSTGFNTNHYYKFINENDNLKSNLLSSKSEYLKSRKQLFKQNDYVEEIYENCLTDLERIEIERMKLEKAFKIRLNDLQINQLSNLLQSQVTLNLSLQSVNLNSNLMGFIDLNKNGNFKPSIYKSPLPKNLSNEFTLINQDLNLLLTDENKKLPLIIELLIDVIYEKVTISGDVFNTVNIETPLSTYHNIQSQLHSLPNKDHYKSLLETFSSSTLFSILKYFLLELSIPLGTFNSYNIAKQVYIISNKTFSDDQLDKIIANIPYYNLNTINALLSLLHSFYELSNKDDNLLNILSNSFNRCIFRPQIENNLTLDDKHISHLLNHLIKTHPNQSISNVLKYKSSSASTTPVKFSSRKSNKPVDQRVLRSTFNSSISSNGSMSNRHLTPDELLDQLEFGKTGLRSRSQSLMSQANDNNDKVDNNNKGKEEKVNNDEGINNDKLNLERDVNVNSDISYVHENNNDNDADSLKHEIYDYNVNDEKHNNVDVTKQSSVHVKDDNVNDNDINDHDINDNQNNDDVHTKVNEDHHDNILEQIIDNQLDSNDHIENESDEDKPPPFVTAAIESDKPIEENESLTPSNSLNRRSRVKPNQLRVVNDA